MQIWSTQIHYLTTGVAHLSRDTEISEVSFKTGWCCARDFWEGSIIPVSARGVELRRYCMDSVT